MEKDKGYSVVLTGAGESKIAVIKEIMAITGLGLKEAKGLVDGAPTPVKEGISKRTADKIASRLRVVGAAVILRSNR